MTYADLRALETLLVLLQLRENYYVEVVPSLTVGRVFLKYARDFCGAMCLNDLWSRIGIIEQKCDFVKNLTSLCPLLLM
jgi:hypothetical protein